MTMNDLVLKTLAEKWKREAEVASRNAAPHGLSIDEAHATGIVAGRCAAKVDCADQILKLLEILGGES